MLRKVVEGSVIQRNHREKTGTLRSRGRMQVRSELAQGGVCRHALNELLALALDGQCYVATASSNFSYCYAAEFAHSHASCADNLLRPTF